MSTQRTRPLVLMVTSVVEDNVSPKKKVAVKKMMVNSGHLNAINVSPPRKKLTAVQRKVIPKLSVMSPNNALTALKRETISAVMRKLIAKHKEKEMETSAQANVVKTHTQLSLLRMVKKFVAVLITDNTVNTLTHANQ